MHELAVACARNQPDAWEAMVARTQPVVARACLRAARHWGVRDPAVVEELIQETYTKLVREALLEGFEPRHPDAIFGFLKVVATRVAHDHCKAAEAAKRGGTERVLSLEELPGEAPARPRPLEQAILLDQIEGWVGESGSGEEVDRDLLIFQLYYRLGMSAAAIASIPTLGLTVKGVESLLHRLIRLAREKANDDKRKKEPYAVR